MSIVLFEKIKKIYYNNYRKKEKEIYKRPGLVVLLLAVIAPQPAAQAELLLYHIHEILSSKNASSILTNFFPKNAKFLCKIEIFFPENSKDC